MTSPSLLSFELAERHHPRRPRGRQSGRKNSDESFHGGAYACLHRSGQRCLPRPFFSGLRIKCLQSWNLHAACPEFTENSVFVATTGKDFPKCGSMNSPCGTISYAVNRTLEGENSSVLINISSGAYNEVDSVKLDCSRSNLRKICFWGQREGEKVAQVDVSFDVQSCEMSIVNLHWKHGIPVSHYALLSNLTICQSTMDHMDGSIIGSSSNIILQDSSITNSSGYRKMLPILSVTSILDYHATLQIKNCNFSDNNGSIIFTVNSQAFIINSLFEGNKVFSANRKIITSQLSYLNVSNTRFVSNFGTLLGVKSSGSLNVRESVFVGNNVHDGSVIMMEGVTIGVVKDCVFQETSSSKEGPVMQLNDNHSSAILENCYFSCNAVSGNVFLPPVFSLGVHQVTCDNCSVDHNFPVHCAPGEFLNSSILCKPCPVGSYSPGVVKNKTVEKCPSCPTGTYGSKQRSAICTLCAKDTFSSKLGSTSCRKCKNDFLTSVPGQASCSKLTLEFIILIVFVCLFITVPLLILLLRKTQSNQKYENVSPHFLREDGEHLIGKRIKSNLSIQNRDMDEDSVSGWAT